VQAPSADGPESRCPDPTRARAASRRRALRPTQPPPPRKRTETLVSTAAPHARRARWYAGVRPHDEPLGARRRARLLPPPATPHWVSSSDAVAESATTNPCRRGRVQRLGGDPDGQHPPERKRSARAAAAAAASRPHTSAIGAMNGTSANGASGPTSRTARSVARRSTARNARSEELRHRVATKPASPIGQPARRCAYVHARVHGDVSRRARNGRVKSTFARHRLRSIKPCVLPNFHCAPANRGLLYRLEANHGLGTCILTRSDACCRLDPSVMGGAASRENTVVSPDAGVPRFERVVDAAVFEARWRTLHAGHYDAGRRPCG